MASINVKEMTNLQKLVPQPFAWPPCELTSPVLLSACLLLFQIPLSTLSLNKLLQDQQAFQLNHYHLHTDKVGTVHQLRSNLNYEGCEMYFQKYGFDMVSSLVLWLASSKSRTNLLIIQTSSQRFHRQ